ncbi:MAG TPA: CPBP family intramembrane metalloprotease [Candidatus Omnitrophota bacterium]|nr:CPBP family intramembrane metalloprotease [Candidatus Omnitrophota bacterium]HPD85218.1 CPBP family intramembrane metalloprotease [Candidatus Omnitrophota bacterium]HRZ04281.1 CPBP family intramembrane metalloprotease [Candidatus Omnitrophota bacterium]
MKKRIFIGCLFAILTLGSLAAWFKFSYPQFSFVDLTVDRAAALKAAETYLFKERNISGEGYRRAIIFSSVVAANRYLQKSLGFEGERDFIQKHHFDLFIWIVRFFKENQKEEFRIAVSAATGKIISFGHTIDDTEKRDSPDEETAQQIAVDFLRDYFHFNPNDYTFDSKQSKKYENRTDHSFCWRKNDVSIPWSSQPDAGTARLLVNATVSGSEIISFTKDTLDIPEKFNRTRERFVSWSQNLFILFKIIYLILLGVATFFVIVRRHHLAMHSVKNFYVFIAASLLITNILFYLSEYSGILFDYPTASSLATYLWNHALEVGIPVFILSVAILMPGLAGESLCREVFPQKKKGGFLHYLISTFCSRDILRLVFLGYVAFIILIGMQSLLFAWGQKSLGVWIEHSWLTQISTSYFPFLAAFVIGFRASIIEEVTFRIFSISWIKKITKSTVLAVIISSVIWGYGHSLYLVYPVWFRGFETTCMGIFLSVIYLAYGIIPAIVAHYAFNVFWNSAGFLLGKTNPFYFYSSLAVLFLPFFLGVIAFFLNRPESERPLRWKLNKHQLYNLAVLKAFLAQENGLNNQTAQQIRSELINHGWDTCVVEAAIEDRLGKNNQQ